MSIGIQIFRVRIRSTCMLMNIMLLTTSQHLFITGIWIVMTASLEFLDLDICIYTQTQHLDTLISLTNIINLTYQHDDTQLEKCWELFLSSIPLEFTEIHNIATCYTIDTLYVWHTFHIPYNWHIHTVHTTLPDVHCLPTTLHGYLQWQHYMDTFND